jgi:uncharacterized protein (TIGR02001 family)
VAGAAVQAGNCPHASFANHTSIEFTASAVQKCIRGAGFVPPVRLHGSGDEAPCRLAGVPPGGQSSRGTIAPGRERPGAQPHNDRDQRLYLPRHQPNPLPPGRASQCRTPPSRQRRLYRQLRLQRPYQSYDVTTEIDLFGGIRLPLGSFNLDILGIWYHYAGLTRRGAQPRLDYVEAILRASRSFGPVTLLATLGASPNYFASSGTGLYFEGGLDWQTGLWGLTLSGRLAHQMLERPANFGAGNYTWWGVNLTRDFAIDGLGTLTATLSYVQTSIARDHCVPIGGRGQDICGARALGSLGFRF